jgi:hypothetical protein
MATGVIRLQWDQTSLLWVTLAEPNRDKSEHTKPFSMADVHPLLGAKLLRQPADEGPDLTQWAHIRANYKMTKLANGKPINRSGESLSPPAGR